MQRSLTAIKQWFQRHIVQEVPTGLSVCEFECQATYCDYTIWRNCEKRQK
ncbi:DNA primase [Crocosphaera sp.]|nr:DNA primase [Crocosphaera sp.]